MQNVAHNNAGPLRKLDYVLAAVKFEQSLFALPFAYIGMLLAADGLPELEPFLWVTLAMVGARNAGMAVNRVFDRNVDALNPRTADRHLPRGLLRPWELSALAVVGLALYFVAAWQLNPLALALSPVGALFVVGYSTVKRVLVVDALHPGHDAGHRARGRLDRRHRRAGVGGGAALLRCRDVRQRLRHLQHRRRHRLRPGARHQGAAGAIWRARRLLGVPHHALDDRLGPAGAGVVAGIAVALLRGAGA